MTDLLVPTVHRPPPPVPVVAAIQAGLLALAAAGLVTDPARLDAGWWDQAAFDVSTALGFALLGTLVLRRRPGHRVGSVMVLIGGLASAGVLARGWQGWLPAAWAAQWLWWPTLALASVAVLVFPDGRLPSRRWRGVLAVLLATLVTGAASLATAALWYPRTLTSDSLLQVSGPAWWLVRVAAGSLAVWGLASLAVCASLIVRLVSADGVVRRQVLCLLAGASALLVVLALDTADAAFELGSVPFLTVVEALVLPTALAVAGLRYRLYDLDVLLNRTVVWTVMSAVVLAAYVAGVLGAGTLVAGGGGRVLTLAVTAAVAVCFEPLRRIVQSAVDRFLFGRRGEPYTVLRDLSQHLADAVDPGEAIPRLVTSVADALRVPYVAVEVGDGLVAAAGRPSTTPETFPLAVRGQPIGRLLVSTRREGEPLTRAERRLLRDLAAQSAGAVEAWLLTLDLRRSRERLVLAREEERRRLRGDLHDGFGPTLLGSALQLDAARRLVDDQDPAAPLIAQVASDLRSCRANLRTLVEGLRPASLDDGLPQAVRQEVARMAAARLAVEVVCPADLGPLPAAVEVAALRIVGEAVANVVRHSGAGNCRVELSPGDRDLEVLVVDDGSGTTVTEGQAGGVGLASLRRRAEELGGTFQVTSTPAGTTLRARLPLPAPAGTSALDPGTPGPLSYDDGVATPAALRLPASERTSR